MAKTCLQLIPNQLDLLITDITACVCYSMQLAMCRDLIHNSLCIPQCPVMRYETVKPFFLLLIQLRCYYRKHWWWQSAIMLIDC